MYSVGAPHTWPLALGALMWLIDNIKVGKKGTANNNGNTKCCAMISVKTSIVFALHQIKWSLSQQEVLFSDFCENSDNIEEGAEYNKVFYPASTNITASILSCSCETQCLFCVQLFLDYTAETYSKFMQCEDTFEEEDEVFLSKLSERWNQYDFGNC